MRQLTFFATTTGQSLYAKKIVHRSDPSKLCQLENECIVIRSLAMEASCQATETLRRRKV